MDIFTGIRNKCCWLMLFVVICFASCEVEDKGFYGFKNEVNVFDGNAYDYLRSKPEVFDSLLLALDRIEWVKDSIINREITLLGIPNNSFSLVIQNLNLLRREEGNTPLYLSTIDSAQLDTLIARYILPGKYPTDSLLLIDGVFMKSMEYNYQIHAQKESRDASGYVDGGPQVILFSDTKGSQFIRDWERTSTQAVNIQCDNAVIHLLVPTHEFGFKEFTARMNK